MFQLRLRRFGVGQVAVADELVERRDGPQFLATSLRVATKQRLGERRAAQTSSLLNRENIGGAKLELPAPVPVDVALIEGLAARGPNLQQEALLTGVKEVDLCAVSGAGRCADKLGGELR